MPDSCPNCGMAKGDGAFIRELAGALIRVWQCICYGCGTTTEGFTR